MTIGQNNGWCEMGHWGCWKLSPFAMLHYQNSIFKSGIVHLSCRLGLKLKTFGREGRLLRQVKGGVVRLIAFQATTLQEMIHVIPHSCGFTIRIQEHSQKTKLAPWGWSGKCFSAYASYCSNNRQPAGPLVNWSWKNTGEEQH